MATAAPSTTDFEAARRAMIDSQLRTSGVNEPWVLARLAAVPREDFVPATARQVAYTDRAVPLGDGRMLAAPLVHARMLAEARPTANDRALVVDGGSGYLPALMEGLAGSLDVVTPDEAVKGARRGDFTLLLVDGAAELIPPALVKRLADGARVVTRSGHRRRHPPRRRPQGGGRGIVAAARRDWHSAPAGVRQAQGVDLLIVFRARLRPALFAGAAMAAFGMAAPAAADTLRDALNGAYRTNPILQGARAQQRATR